jgi:hypothetical protein
VHHCRWLEHDVQKIVFQTVASSDSNSTPDHVENANLAMPTVRESATMEE